MNSLEYSLRTETLTKYFHECKRSKKYENDDNEKNRMDGLHESMKTIANEHCV